MRHGLRRPLLALLRLLSLLMLATLGTVVLVRCAPGYFSSTQEMDGEHGTHARAQVAAQQQAEGTAFQQFLRFCKGLISGDPGVSHQYGVPVLPLLLPRLRVTGLLLALAAVPAPLLALLCALPASQLRAPVLERAVAAATLLGIAVPVSVLASACLLSGVGGPATVLLLAVAARDFRFFTRLLRRQNKVPYLLYTRAYGARPMSVMVHAVLRPLRREMVSLLALSFLTALSGIIPVEVIFGVPGAGQMAWNAAMNRDLPVLLTVTLPLALCVAVASLLANGSGLQQHGAAA